jgi:metal-responsive CopG/Arc/MetJ family transcriptional regulator
MAAKKESPPGPLALRVPQELIDKLDALTQGKLSRSQLVRLVLEDFLARDEAEQQALIMRGLFGRSKE